MTNVIRFTSEDLSSLEIGKLDSTKWEAKLREVKNEYLLSIETIHKSSIYNDLPINSLMDSLYSDTVYTLYSYLYCCIKDNIINNTTLQVMGREISAINKIADYIVSRHSKAIYSYIDDIILSWLVN